MEKKGSENRMTEEQKEIIKKCDMYLRRQNKIGDWEVVGKDKFGTKEYILGEWIEEKDSKEFWNKLMERVDKNEGEGEEERADMLNNWIKELKK